MLYLIVHGLVHSDKQTILIIIFTFSFVSLDDNDLDALKCEEKDMEQNSLTLGSVLKHLIRGL